MKKGAVAAVSPLWLKIALVTITWLGAAFFFTTVLPALLIGRFQPDWAGTWPKSGSLTEKFIIVLTAIVLPLVVTVGQSRLLRKRGLLASFGFVALWLVFVSALFWLVGFR